MNEVAKLVMFTLSPRITLTIRGFMDARFCINVVLYSITISLAQPKINPFPQIFPVWYRWSNILYFLLKWYIDHENELLVLGLMKNKLVELNIVNKSNMTYIYLWLHPKQGSLALHKTITADIIIDIIKWGFYGRKMFDRLERKTH